jgi:hypothetical protein
VPPHLAQDILKNQNQNQKKKKKETKKTKNLAEYS